MQLLTVTSDNYVEITRGLLRSVRAWHPELPVAVYVLDTGWSAKYESLLTPFNVDIRVVHEHGNLGNRTSWSGGGIYNAYKLDVFLEQTQPFLFLDSDILVLRPLDRLFDHIRHHGWLTCHDGVPLGDYTQGPISKLVSIPEADAKQRGFNTGVLGCMPESGRDVLLQARQWVDQVSENFLGDQGLLNLAWWVKRGRVPPNADSRFNGGWREDDRIELRNTIVHFARRDYGGPSKLHDQTRVWNAWPKGVALTDLIDTPFWQQSLPHPWAWLNQANQRKHRAFLRHMRAESRSLLGMRWLLIEDADHAFLLDGKVLAEQEKFWAANAASFKDVPHKPVYHLPGGGRPASAWSHRWDRFRRRWLR
jgi:hypothetical protein